jgi:hypothetical protein
VRFFCIDLCKGESSWNPSAKTSRAPRAPSVEIGRWQHTQAEALLVTFAFYKYDAASLAFLMFFHNPSLIHVLFYFHCLLCFKHAHRGRGRLICCLQDVPHFSDKAHLVRWIECGKNLWQWACLQRKYPRILRPQAVVESPI